MIRTCGAEDAPRMHFIINEAARAYEGVIPPDCYHRPYMSIEELQAEMKRVSFAGWEEDGELVGIMGIERVDDVTLIRHAYVLPAWQKKGIGTRLLQHLSGTATTSRTLVGTWADARWAIAFYQGHGFRLLEDKDRLLSDYWDIPRRQIETSVVMGMGK